MTTETPKMPSGVNGDLSLFDRSATVVAARVAAWFFIACMLLVVIWAPTFILLNIDT